MRIRTQLKAGAMVSNHSEGLRVRTTVKAGVKTGGWANHSEALRIRQDDRDAISMRRTLPTTRRKEDRLELLVVRAGLRAGARHRRFQSARGRNRI